MNSYKKTLIAIHVAVWLVILISPLTFFDRGERFEADKLIPMLSTPIAMMLVFYTTYLDIYHSIGDSSGIRTTYLVSGEP